MKKEKKQNPDAAAFRNKMASKIAGSILWVQKKWAEAMGRMVKRLRPGTRKAVFISAAVLMMLYSGYLVAFSFSNNIRMKGPASIKIPHTVNGSRATRITKDTPGFMIPLTRFHRYLDSLQGSGSGRRIRDSLLRERPGLLDSIIDLERLWCR